MSQIPNESLVYTNRAIVNPQQFAGIKHIEITNSANNSFCFTVEPAAAMREHEMGFNVPMVSMRMMKRFQPHDLSPYFYDCILAKMGSAFA